MSESPPQRGPEEQQGQTFGAPPGSAQWPQGGFGSPSGAPARPGPMQPPNDPTFNPQPYGGQYPPPPTAQPPAHPPQGGYPQQPGGIPQQPGGYPQQPGGYPQQPGGYPQQPGGYPQQPGGIPQQPGGYSQQFPQAAYAGYAPTTASFPASTAVLLAVSVIAAIATGIIGIPSAIMAALAWRRNGTDPAGAARHTTKGWIVLGVNFAVGILLLIPFYVWASNNS